MSAYVPAPSDWCYHGFPLRVAGLEALSLDWVAELAERLLDTADSADAPYLHWAHILRAEQGTGGNWPAVVNARTGEQLGTGRTRRPAVFLKRLGEALGSIEFDDVVARAACEPPPACVGPREAARVP